jgi:hypothetical protein
MFGLVKFEFYRQNTITIHQGGGRKRCSTVAPLRATKAKRESQRRKGGKRKKEIEEEENRKRARGRKKGREEGRKVGRN